jgi:hypothetical protein
MKCSVTKNFLSVPGEIWMFANNFWLENDALSTVLKSVHSSLLWLHCENEDAAPADPHL